MALSILIVSCKRDDDVYTIGGKNGQAPTRFLTITTLSATQQEADTASLITINLQIAANADSASHTITINTSLGKFSNGKATGTITAGADGKASISLHSGTLGNAQLSFTAKNITVDTTIKFIAALPEDMLLTADKYSGDSTSTFGLSTTLVRNTGKGIVTDPVKVFYSVRPASPGATLVLPTFSESIKGTADCIVSNPYKVKGRFTIMAASPKAGGDTLRKYITLIVK